MPTKSLFKKYLVTSIVVSLVAAALLGIVALLSGEFNDISWRVLITTLVIGVFSITSLASLRGFESKVVEELWVSRAGIVASLVAAVTVLLLVWADNLGGEGLAKTAAVVSVLAVGFAHISLILPFRSRSALSSMLTLTTCAAVAVVAGLIISLIFVEDLSEGGSVYRVLGVFAILDVLGTILIPVLSKMLPKSR